MNVIHVFRLRLISKKNRVELSQTHKFQAIATGLLDKSGLIFPNHYNPRIIIEEIVVFRYSSE